MPAGAVEHDDGVGAWSDLAADLLQMQVNGPDVGVGHDPGCAHPAGGTDGAEQVGPFVPLVLGGGGPSAPLGQAPGRGSLLPDGGLVLPPNLERPPPPSLGDDAP